MNHATASRVVSILVCATLFACAPDWEEAFDGSSHGALSGVWGSGPDDVFIVGGSFEQAEIIHFDGSDWADMEAPDLPLLAWVTGWGPDQAMAVGVDGAAAWYDGASWEVMPTPTDQDLWGVFGFTADDVWVVGGDAGVGEPVILRWDGDAFEDVGLATDENPRGATSLFKVWGIDDTLFAVGQLGQIVRWDGAAWRDSPAGAVADQDFISLWGTSEDRIVAVGGRGNARVATWDGSAWETVAPSGQGGINAVSMEDNHVALVGGIGGVLGTFRPDDGTIELEEMVTGGDVHAIWGDGQGRWHAVGGNFNDPMTGLAWTRTGPLR
jgi:hypothetical protein